MTQVNVEIIRSAYERMSRHGIEDALDAVAEDAVVRVAGEETELRGPQAFAELCAGYARAFEEFRAEPFELIDAGNAVVAGLRIGGVAAATGTESWARVFHVHTLLLGRTVRLETFHTRAAALRCAAEAADRAAHQKPT